MMRRCNNGRDSAVMWWWFPSVNSTCYASRIKPIKSYIGNALTRLWFTWNMITAVQLSSNLVQLKTISKPLIICFLWPLLSVHSSNTSNDKLYPKLKWITSTIPLLPTLKPFFCLTYHFCLVCSSPLHSPADPILQNPPSWNCPYISSRSQSTTLSLWSISLQSTLWWHYATHWNRNGIQKLRNRDLPWEFFTYFLLLSCP